MLGEIERADPGEQTCSSCCTNCAAITSPHGWSDPPPCPFRAAGLPFLFNTESSQSYSTDSTPSRLASPPLLGFLLHSLWLSLPSSGSRSHWFLCAGLVFPEKSSMISVFVPPALPSPLLHFTLQAPLPYHPVGLCWFPRLDCLFLASSLRIHMHQGFFFSAGSPLPCICCLGKEMEIVAFAGWGMSQHGDGSSPTQWNRAWCW